MNDCGWQERVQAAARAGAADPETSAHLLSCSVCREMELTVRLLRAEGRAAERSAWDRLPAPDALVAKAKVHAVPEASVPPVLWPIIWAERLGVAALAVVTGVALVAVARRWPEWAGADPVEILRDHGTSLTSTLATVPAESDPVAMVLVLGVVAILAAAVHGFSDSRRGLR